jgi:O-acetyl-ADP-ribose deacetylase (regulator of RNase III)
MRWILKQGNIIDEPADVLICSANVSLNLSGGVGAELLSRYGTAQQDYLHTLITTRSPRYAKQGEIFSYESTDIPYRAILHAVAVDAWYQSSSKTIEQVVERALRMASTYDARKVALTALATGFGNLSVEEFAKGVRPLLVMTIPSIQEIVIALIEESRLTELARFLPEATVIN